MALYSLAGHGNMVGWRLVLNYVQTPTTKYGFMTISYICYIVLNLVQSFYDLVYDFMFYNHD